METKDPRQRAGVKIEISIGYEELELLHRTLLVLLTIIEIANHLLK